MPTYPRIGAKRCFDKTQDLLWHGNYNSFFNKFKENFPQYKDLSNKELKNVVDNFWKYCGKVLIETPHGIYLDRIGYISMTVFNINKIKFDKGKNQTHFNFKNNNIYRCYFYPISKHLSVFRQWMFSLSKEHKLKLKNKIVNDRILYKNHIHFLDKNSQSLKSF